MHGSADSADLERALLTDEDAFESEVLRNQHLLDVIDAFLFDSVQLKHYQALRLSFPPDKRQQLTSVSRRIYLLFMRIFDFIGKRRRKKLLNGFLHPSRIVQFCDIFAATNELNVRVAFRTLIQEIPEFKRSLASLGDLYITGLRSTCSSLKRHAIAKWETSAVKIYEIISSLYCLLCKAQLPIIMLSSARDSLSDLGKLGNAQALLHELTLCYEHFLPAFHRHIQELELNDEWIVLLIGVTRKNILQNTEYLICNEVKHGPEDLKGEKLLETLHSLSAFTMEEENAEHGTLLSDLWTHGKFEHHCKELLMTSELEPDHLAYLQMIIDGLPQRRCVISQEQPSKENMQESAANLFSSGDPKIQEGTNANDVSSSKIDQVKELFPSYGNGFIKLLLLSCDSKVEAAINALLEETIPKELENVRHDLKMDDDQFQQLYDIMIGNIHTSPEKKTVDRYWVGKRENVSSNDSKNRAENLAAVEKTREILRQYDTAAEDEVWFEERALEYDDDYDDEFDEHQHFGVNDDRLGDLDEIREQNRRIREKEAEEAYWESMRNPNHKVRDDVHSEKEEINTADSNEASDGELALNKQQVLKNPNESVAPGQNVDNKRQLQQSRNFKNKSKSSNHHRKERAMKKRFNANG